MHDVSQSVRRITLFDRDFSLLPIWIAGSDCQNRGHRNQRNGRPSSKRGGTERSSFTLVSWTERGDQQCLPSYMTSSNHVCLLHSKKHLLYIYNYRALLPPSPCPPPTSKKECDRRWTICTWIRRAIGENVAVRSKHTKNLRFVKAGVSQQATRQVALFTIWIPFPSPLPRQSPRQYG